MRVIDRGSGSPLVLIPGIQGRWEWMRPAVDALTQQCRVLTFSFADEPSCGGDFDPDHGFSCYLRQVADAIDAAGVGQAAVCGVSYGGLIAAAFAARYPERVSSLILVSAIPPTWRPDPRVSFYLRAPRLLTPIFMAASVRMYREIAAAYPSTLRGLLAAGRHALTVLSHMFSPARMARRVRILEGVDLEAELQSLRVPTLVVTGEARLDRVVPVEATREYSRMWPHAEQVTLANTGHLGLITRPIEFARIVTSFVDRASQDEKRKRVV